MKNQIKLSELAGPLEISRRDYSDQISTTEASFCLLLHGSYQAIVDNNGDFAAFRGNTLNDVIEKTEWYCKYMKFNAFTMLCYGRARDEARKWELENEVITAESPLAAFTTVQLCDELKRRHVAGQSL